MDAAVNPSGTLCKNTARKITQPSQLETRKPEAMAIPSKNVWMASPSRTLIKIGFMGRSRREYHGVGRFTETDPLSSISVRRLSRAVAETPCISVQFSALPETCLQADVSEANQQTSATVANMHYISI